MLQPKSRSQRALPDVRTIWRWHFYAGLFCVPFVLWLSLTGIVYLFKPQIERWMDRPYEGLLKTGEIGAPPEVLVQAALTAVPGSTLSYYELPRVPGSAPQIVVGKGADEYRVYVHPRTAQVLEHFDQRDRLFAKVFLLHGELMAGAKGSMLIELAGCWTIVLILTGLALWWPRGQFRAAGYLFPRLQLTGRLWWKDVHAVTGVWVSFLVIALLLTGLPWAKSWGGYFRFVRSSLAGINTVPDWPMGSESERAVATARNAARAAALAGEVPSGQHQHHAPPAEKAPSRFGSRSPKPPAAPGAYLPINRLLPIVERLSLAHPVQILPPVRKGGSWFARSNSQNRTLQDSYTLDAKTGAVLRHEAFSDKPLVDRVVSAGVAYHEGQLFGLLNQLVGLSTALGAALLSISSVVMWWRRRPSGVLGAPVASERPAMAPLLIGFIVFLSVAFPLLAISITVLLLFERLVLQRLPGVSRWLGLRPALEAS